MESPGPGSPWRLPVLLALVQLTNPNIPKAHWVTVSLQTQWQLVRRWLVGRALVVRGRTRQFHVVLYEHSVVQHRHPRRMQHLAIFIEMGSVKNHVIGLPLSRRPGGI